MFPSSSGVLVHNYNAAVQTEEVTGVFPPSDFRHPLNLAVCPSSVHYSVIRLSSLLQSGHVPGSFLDFYNYGSLETAGQIAVDCPA